MDLNGCSTKGPQKVARENLTQNTFPPFFFAGGGGRTGQKNNNCLNFVLNAKCVCTLELECLPFLYTCFWSSSIFAQDMTTFMGFSCGEARGVEVPSSRGGTDLDSCRLTWCCSSGDNVIPSTELSRLPTSSCLSIRLRS